MTKKSAEKKEYCGKCWKLDRPKSYCNRYRKVVEGKRSELSRAGDVFYKVLECISANDKISETGR